MKKNTANLDIIVIIISLIKEILSKKTYLQLLAPALGWYSLFKEKTILKITLPLLVMALLSILAMVTSRISPFLIMKNIQFSGLALFISWGFKKFTSEKILKLITITELTSIFFHVFDNFLFNEQQVRDIWGHSFQRYNGIIGEPNYSALLYLIFFIVNFENKRIKNMLIDSLLILSTFSRMAIMVLLIYLFLKMIQKTVFEKGCKFIFGCILASFLLYPLIVYKSWDFLSSNQKLTLAEKSADRYIIHSVYVDLAKSKFIGSGFGGFDETFNFKTIPEKYHNVIKLKKQNYSRKQQHNTLIQVLTEFGLIGYVVYVTFLLILYNAIIKKDITLLPSFISVIMAQQFLNTLSEIGIYIYYIYIIVQLSKNEKFKLTHMRLCNNV